jgi:PAS domain S-box-containing protein
MQVRLTMRAGLGPGLTAGWPLAAAAALLHYVTALLTLLWHAQPGFAVFWPSAGIAAGMLIALGPRSRPALAVAVPFAITAANISVGRPFIACAIFGICDMIESLLVATIAGRLMGPSRRFSSLRDLGGFLVAALIGTIVTAIVASGLFKLILGFPEPFLHLATDWFEATFVGVCTSAPLVILIPTLFRDYARPQALAEGALGLLVLTVAAVWFYGGFLPMGGALSLFAGGTALLPLVMWIAARAPAAFAGASVAIVALVVVYCTSNGLGSFGDPSLALADRVLAAQITMLAFAGCALPISTLFCERRRAESSLQLANGELSALSSTLEHRVTERTQDLRIANRELTREAEERERVTADLRRSEAQLRAAQRVAGLGSFSLAVSPSDEPHWSDEARRITGHSSPGDGSLAAFVSKIVHEQDRTRVAEALEEAGATGQGLSIEYRVRRPDGTERTVLTAVEPAVDALGVTRLLCTALDVTERNATEQKITEHRTQLLHLERMATAGELATMVAHEVNQPLSAISRTASALIRLDAAGNLKPAELTEHLRELSLQAQRASGIIRQIRQYVQKRPSKVEPLDIDKVIADVLLLVGPFARRQNVKLAHTVTRGLPRIMGEEVQLGQLIMNLLRNGIDAVLDQPVERRRVAIRSMQRNGQVVVEIEDSGPPISDEVKSRMLEPFFTTKAEGLGMGLPISVTIAEALGGRLEIASSETGTVARVMLPQTAAASEKTDPGSSAQGGRR